ncbi:MAG: LUD domain-containing protein [Arachidicoccus sp.]|nr:LUD domain-containing protein [Arachidicoccus sp.]
MQSPKERILKKIRTALTHATEIPFPDVKNMESKDTFHYTKEDLTVTFAENFSKAGGNFFYCSNAAELSTQLKQLLIKKENIKAFCREPKLINFLQHADFHALEFSKFSECKAAITTCEKLIARTGSILMSSAQPGGRTTSVYAPIHICIAFTNEIVYDIFEGLEYMQQSKQNFPSLITLATGPSRTADIEKTLVVGVHGPKEVYCFVVENGF